MNEYFLDRRIARHPHFRRPTDDKFLGYSEILLSQERLNGVHRSHRSLACRWKIPFHSLLAFSLPLSLENEVTLLDHFRWYRETASKSKQSTRLRLDSCSMDRPSNNRYPLPIAFLRLPKIEMVD